jgi:hypothetical protein
VGSIVVDERVMAIETDDPNSPNSIGQAGRVHPYDAIDGHVANQLSVSHVVEKTWWGEITLRASDASTAWRSSAKKVPGDSPGQ